MMEQAMIRIMWTAALLLLAPAATADNISPWSTTGCGTWSATNQKGTTLGPATSISPDTTQGFGGNYGVNLNLSNCAGQQGPPGPQGPAGAAGVPGAPGVAGPMGINGVSGLTGFLTQIIALDSAMSQPAWLEKGERYSLSGGFGFSDTTLDNKFRAPAFGLTGVMRLGPNAAGFGSVGYEPTFGLWGGRIGARFGW